MNEIISLKWNNYSSTFLKTLQKFQNKENLCDSTLTCHGKFYPVHRLVLSLCSEYFENIYEKTPCKHPFLIINDIEPIHLEALLNFIYQGEVQVTQENLPKFIKAAEYLKIKGLISDANSRKGNVIFNSYDDFNIYSNKSEFIHVINEDRKRNIRFNNVSHGSKNNVNMAPVILDPHVPIERLTGCVYDSVLSIYNLQKHTEIKEENEFVSVSSKNKNKQSNNCKIAKVKASSKKSKCFRSPSEPMRISPRKMKPIVNYYIPDTAGNNFDNEENITSSNENLNFIEEDLMPQITISSYSGGNGEEFNSIQNSINFESEESVKVKVELTEYSVEGNGAKLDLCGLKSELTTEEDSKLFNVSTDLPESSSVAAIDNEDVFIDETYSCETFGDLLKNYNKIDGDDAAVKVEFPEFYTDENGYLESSSTFTLKSELFTEEEEEYSNLMGCDYNSKVLENSFQDDLSTNQILGGRDSEDSEINSLCQGSLDECKVYFSSKGLMVPVLGDELQKQTMNCTPTKFDKDNCKFCPYVSSKRFLKFHESAHVSKYSYKCKFCWYRSVLKWNTLKHQECCYKNLIGKSLKVSLDSKIGLNNKKRTFKVSSESKHGKYKCHLCSYSSKYAGYLKMHRRAHTDKKLKCNLCSFSSIFKPVMTRHKLRVHMKFSSIANGIQIFQCRECPFSSKHRNVVDKHENCHTSHNLYKCGTCSYSANKRGYILRHELLHYAVQSKIPSKNSFLSGTVNSKSAFTKFKCGLCQFSSKYKMVVSRHERVHTKKYLIKTQKGSGVTKRLTVLSNHKKTNKLRNGSDHMTINKMYKCRFCPYEADLNVRILEHETHHKIKKRNKCPKCSFSSDNIGRVNSHELLHNIITTGECDSFLSFT